MLGCGRTFEQVLKLLGGTEEQVQSLGQLDVRVLPAQLVAAPGEQGSRHLHPVGIAGLRVLENGAPELVPVGPVERVVEGRPARRTGVERVQDDVSTLPVVSPDEIELRV